MQNRWKKHNHKIDTKFITGNTKGEENTTKIPLYKMSKRQAKTSCSPLSVLSLSLSLSPMHYTSEWVCVQIRTTTPLFILVVNWPFSLDTSTPINCLGQIHLGILKTIYYIINWGTKVLTQEEDLSPHDSMMTKYNSNTLSKEE